MASRCFPYRPHDYVYDPIFTVSGPVDHYKAAVVAKMSTVKFQICPIFPNMFSDLPNHPRTQLVARKTRPVPLRPLRSSRPKDPALVRTVDVAGADRAKFFCPIINFPPKDTLPYMCFPTFTIEKYVKPKSKVVKGTRSVKVETKFRESEAQTIPWQPPYVVVGQGDPEILKLSFLKYGSGLPAGMQEIGLIERARMKSAWEKTMKPNPNDESSLIRFRDYMEALERDEWAFREKEIQDIQSLRLQLLENMLSEVYQKSQQRAQLKLQNFITIKQHEKEQQIAKIRKKTARELRKLHAARRGMVKKYREVNIVQEHADKKSEIYGPLMRHGEHPKRWHQVIDERLKKYKAQFIGVEQFSTLPGWLEQATKLGKTHINPKISKSTRLCIKETKWTAPVLKELHEELKNFTNETKKQPVSLRQKVGTPPSEVPTPEVEGVTEFEEDQYQAIVFLQSIIRGRATQMMIYEGRDTCKELIRELKHTVGFLKREKEQRRKEKLRVKAQQREEMVHLDMMQRLEGTLGSLQGSIVGTLFDFLNKELRRLLEERKAHAMCLVNERERYVREAAEAGRRQKELRRRREHDEMFKQIIKVTQDSVDMYLHDIITEGMEFASKDEATEYVTKLADRIEKETSEAYEASKNISIDEHDEVIADMVHHFVLPEIQKILVRNKMRQQQKQKLKTIHDSIYSKFEDLPRIEYSKMNLPLSPTPTTSTSSYTETKTEEIAHKVENLLYQDPYELYLAKLAEQEREADDFTDDGFVTLPPDDPNDYDFRHDDLETITEVDTENTSVKPPANTESSSEVLD